MTRPMIRPTTPPAIWAAGRRRNSRSIPETAPTVSRPNTPPSTYPQAAPRKTYRTVLRSFASIRAAPSWYPTAPSRAMKMRRTPSTTRPRSRVVRLSSVICPRRPTRIEPPMDTSEGPGGHLRGGLGRGGSGLCGRDLDAVGVVQGGVDRGLGLVLGLVGREGKLGDQDLPGLGDHALLTRGQALLAVSDREVAQDLGHLVRVTGVQLLEVVLEAAAPVSGHRAFVLGQDLQDLLGLVLADARPQADLIGRVGRHEDGQVAVDDPQHQEVKLLAEEFLLAHFFDYCGPVFGVHDGVAF